MQSINLHVLRGSWRSWVVSDEPRVGPWWLQCLWTVLFSMALALGFTVLGFVVSVEDVQNWWQLDRWLFWYQKNLVMCLTIAFLIHGLFGLSIRLLGGPAGVRELRPLQRGLLFTGLPVLGVLIGWPLGFWLSGVGSQVFFGSEEDLRALVVSIVLSAILSLLLYQWFSVKARALQAERAAAQAQLRLLQAQIEPHFLFNTLANVEALIELQPAKAKEVLAAFTDYLRAGLLGLRRDAGLLEDELALAEAYLRVQQTRMGDRLQFNIDASEKLRRCKLPPLLLQPLVENAVHHGLEPKLAGGTVSVRAYAECEWLVLEVEDDGAGLGSSARPGAGLALTNMRQRLMHQFGAEASLVLKTTSSGTRVALKLPLIGMADE